MKEIIDLAERTLTLRRGEMLKGKGAVDTNVYFLEQGSLRIFLDSEGEQVIRLGYRGNLVVLMDSFLTDGPSELCVQAIKKTVLKVIPKTRVTAFLASGQNVHIWVKILESLALQQLEREIDLLAHSPKDRYLRVLRRSPQLFQEVPHKHIANYLRMSPETLSRLKKS